MTYSTLLEQHSGRSAVPYSGWSDHLHVSQPGSNAQSNGKHNCISS